MLSGVENVTVPGTLFDAAGTGTATVWAVGYRPQPSRPATLAMRTTNG